MVKRLGAKKSPLVLRTRTMERASELLELCTSRGLHAIVGIEEDKEEDISDLGRALARLPAPSRSGIIAPARNGPCPCGSGRKYKNCCAPE